MALVATPARATTGSVSQHGPQPGEGYEHPQPTAPPPQNLVTRSVAPLPASQSTPNLPQASPGAEPERFLAASVPRRIFAALLDLFILLPLCAVAGLLLCLSLDQPVPRLAELSPDLLFAGLLDGSPAGEGLLVLSGVLFFIYFFVFHAARGQTPGKKLLGLCVIDPYGNIPGVGRTLVRTIGYLISALPCSLGFLWVGFDRERRALHDWLAGTYVVRLP